MSVKPKKYTLLTNIFYIVYKNEVLNNDGEWMYGECIGKGDHYEIQISTKNQEGEQLSEDIIQSTLRHELFHLILDTLYFTEESGNETLVEWLANATLTLNKQGLTI